MQSIDVASLRGSFEQALFLVVSAAAATVSEHVSGNAFSSNIPHLIRFFSLYEHCRENLVVCKCGMIGFPAACIVMSLPTEVFSHMDTANHLIGLDRGQKDHAATFEMVKASRFLYTSNPAACYEYCPG